MRSRVNSITTSLGVVLGSRGGTDGEACYSGGKFMPGCFCALRGCTRLLSRPVCVCVSLHPQGLYLAGYKRRRSRFCRADARKRNSPSCGFLPTSGACLADEGCKPRIRGNWFNAHQRSNVTSPTQMFVYDRDWAHSRREGTSVGRTSKGQSASHYGGRPWKLNEWV